MPSAVGTHHAQGEEIPQGSKSGAPRATHLMKRHGHGDKRAVQHANLQKESQMEGAGSNQAGVHSETKAIARGAGRSGRQGAEFD